MFFAVLGGLIGCQSSQISIPNRVVDGEKEAVSFQYFQGVLMYHHEPFSGFIVKRYSSNRLQSKEGYWLGKAEGMHQKWYENGALAEQRTYHHNQKQGVHKGWWSNRQLRFEYQFNNDLAVGTHREWYANKQLYSLNTYDDTGRQEGTQKMWYSSGQLKANYVIQNGRRFGLLGAKGCMGENERKTTTL